MSINLRAPLTSERPLRYSSVQPPTGGPGLPLPSNWIQKRRRVRRLQSLQCGLFFCSMRTSYGRALRALF